MPLDRARRRGEHREARGAGRGRADRVLPGLDAPVPTIRCGAGVVTKRVMEAAEAARARLRRRPHLRRRLVHRRQRRDERRAARRRCCGAPRSTTSHRGAWSRRTRSGSRSSASTTTWARSTTPPSRASGCAASSADGATLVRGDARDAGRAGFARRAWARTSPTSSWPGCPGVQKEGMRRHHHVGARFVLHRMPAHDAHRLPRVLRRRCTTPCPRSSRSSATSTPTPGATARRPRASRRALRARRSATRPRRSGSGRPRMVLIGDIVGDERRRGRERRPRAVVRIANARGGEGFVAVSPEARKRFWLDRARTAAIAKHTNAFKINEDVVIPLERLGDYTDGIERINIELSLAQQARARWTRSRRYLGGELPLWRGDEARLDRGRAASATGPPQALELDARRARSAGRACVGRSSTRRFARCSRRARARVVEDRGARRRCARIFAGRAFAPVLAGAEAVHARGAARARVRRAAHARRRRQRAHQHPGQLRRLRDAAARRTRRSRASCACARASAA